MKINPQDVKVPLLKKVEYKSGEIEVSLSKRDSDSSVSYQEFVSEYVSMNESTASQEDSIKDAMVQYEKYETIISEATEEGELTPAQKKLPPAIQKVLLKKLKSKEKPEPGETKKQEKAESPEEEKKEQKEAKAAKDTKKPEVDEKGNKNGEEVNPCKDSSCATCTKAKKAKDVEDEEEEIQKKNDIDNTKASSQKTTNLTKDDKKSQKPLADEMKK